MYSQPTNTAPTRMLTDNELNQVSGGTAGTSGIRFNPQPDPPGIVSHNPPAGLRGTVTRNPPADLLVPPDPY